MPRPVKAGPDAFETLVATIISQNTADTNTERAYRKLEENLKLTPKALAAAPVSQIEDCIKVAGLWQAKAEAIKAASQVILDCYGGSLDTILEMPLEEARKVFMSMQGVGPKTADVVLLFSASKPTIPVDTHVNRVSRRLGLAPLLGGYNAVRLSLQAYFKPEDYLAVHLLLIGLGRKYCKAHNPLCSTCPVNQYCPLTGGRHR